MTGLECFGTTIPNLNTFDDCCGAVLADNTLARSFLSRGLCSPCYGMALIMTVKVEENRYFLYTRSNWAGGGQLCTE